LFALATGRGRQFVRDWLPLTGVAALFVVLRQVAAGSPFPHRGADVAALEAALFGGVTPTAALQRLRADGNWSAIDAVATLVHGSYFFAFVVVGLWLWLRRRALFSAYSAALGLTFALGLVGYFALPTEPPWLVGRLTPAPHASRVIVETTRGAPVASAIVEAGRRWQTDPDALGDPNPAAAMPSVHVAITAALGLFLFRVHPLAGAGGIFYVVAMGAALVYLGEHFVLDEIVGLACAACALELTRRLALLRSALGSSPAFSGGAARGSRRRLSARVG
jgi:hypothetical protein